MKLGFLSMPLSGHLNPMVGLAQELSDRGHQIVFFGLLDAEQIVRAANLEFVPFGEDEYPLGATPAAYAHVATLEGEDVIRYVAQEMQPRRCAVTLERLPTKIKQTGVEAMIIDVTHYYAELVPMNLGLPYVHIWNVLHIDGSGMTPPCIFGTQYETTKNAIVRNTVAAQKISRAFQPARELGRAWAEKQGLVIDWREPDATLSKLAVITQTPKVFDFPGTPSSAAFHHAGPLGTRAGRRTIPFDWEQLDKRPLIYASMGTLVNGSENVFRAILGAVEKITHAQLVLVSGNNLELEKLEPIPSNAVVVPEAPQMELLKRAALCITHAGLNTVLESLSMGVPMVAIPVGFDQPGVASRIAYHRLGEVLTLESLTPEALFQAICKVMEESSYRDNALYFQESIARNPGPKIAADVIESVFRGLSRAA